MLREVPSWHQHFFELSEVIAKRSKDENTQIGAVIVGAGKEIVSTGYNSFPRGVQDYYPERQERPEKYFWFEHAERNAIYNAARTGASLKDCILYVPAIPCMDCARGIVQVGIKKVIIKESEIVKWMSKPKWGEQVARTVTLFKEAGVSLCVWNELTSAENDYDFWYVLYGKKYEQDISGSSEKS